MVQLQNKDEQSGILIRFLFYYDVILGASQTHQLHSSPFWLKGRGKWCTYSSNGPVVKKQLTIHTILEGCRIITIGPVLKNFGPIPSLVLLLPKSCPKSEAHLSDESVVVWRQ